MSVFEILCPRNSRKSSPTSYDVLSEGIVLLFMSVVYVLDVAPKALGDFLTQNEPFITEKDSI